jgi:HD-like signal output (HDOD) protein
MKNGPAKQLLRLADSTAKGAGIAHVVTSHYLAMQQPGASKAEYYAANMIHQLGHVNPVVVGLGAAAGLGYGINRRLKEVKAEQEEAAQPRRRNTSFADGQTNARR